MKENRRLVSSPFEQSELILNEDNSVYHLRVKDENIADLVLLVGDQNRVGRISSHFESIDFQVENREFITHTGIYNGSRVTAMSSGIGADNIDIVLNELDAAVNIDPITRLPKADKRTLEIVRIGTSGSLQENIPVDSYVVSEFGLGFDGVLNFYDVQFDSDELALESAFKTHTSWNDRFNTPYAVKADSQLVQTLQGKNVSNGITITANGFYGPQGRRLMLNMADNKLNQALTSFRSALGRITNYEMETAALYGLSALLGHKACTICAIIANRLAGTYSKNYKSTVDEMITFTLNRLTSRSE